MLKKKKTHLLHYPTMPLLPKTPMWKLPPSQSLEFAHQLSHIQNTISHHETHTKPQWQNKPSAFMAQTSTIASIHDHIFSITPKYLWCKQKTWMLWATSNA